MGVGAPTVKKLNIAVNKIHKMFGLVSPAHDDEYQEHCGRAADRAHQQPRCA